MQPSGRCPRCGYVLRFDGRSYTCDFCGYPHTHGTMTGELQRLERSLRSKAQSLVQTLKRPLSHQVFVYYPVAVHPCASCGINISFGTIRCPKCGAPQEIPRPASDTTESSPQFQNVERNVLDYIIAHNGTISVSQAARDLNLSPDSLQSTIQRLKTAGFLDQA